MSTGRCSVEDDAVELGLEPFMPSSFFNLWAKPTFPRRNFLLVWRNAPQMRPVAALSQTADTKRPAGNRDEQKPHTSDCTAAAEANILQSRAACPGMGTNGPLVAAAGCGVSRRRGCSGPPSATQRRSGHRMHEGRGACNGGICNMRQQRRKRQQWHKREGLPGKATALLRFVLGRRHGIRRRAHLMPREFE
eukprot:CAMPEP_0170401022 /NCGR_PEP_ID=MMETSP0117_2-20130122/24804_1 /TAXON_ID=400756 /ORGANISM="Durinskia baltica, Strain CSIRO CS-38" /LENGTH=191 /DNA_ID=CAMNT_0010657799 /DNA_START=59 /DNA_END=632 /DNA_ORIENTATION=+